MFWRNTDTTTFDTGDQGIILSGALDKLRHSGNARCAEAVESFFQCLPPALDNLATRDHCSARWHIQDHYACEATFRVSLIAKGIKEKIQSSVVGGGISLFIENKESIIGDLVRSYQRQVCGNGMTLTMKSCSHFEADTLDQWTETIEDVLPRVLEGVGAGFMPLSLSPSISLRLHRPALAGIASRLGFESPVQEIILDSFGIEPGNTLWHLVNALTRAANVVMTRPEIPREAAWAQRQLLQRTPLDLCERFLDDLPRARRFLGIDSEVQDRYTTATRMSRLLRQLRHEADASDDHASSPLSKIDK